MKSSLQVIGEDLLTSSNCPPSSQDEKGFPPILQTTYLTSHGVSSIVDPSLNKFSKLPQDESFEDDEEVNEDKQEIITSGWQPHLSCQVLGSGKNNFAKSKARSLAARKTTGKNSLNNTIQTFKSSKNTNSYFSSPLCVLRVEAYSPPPKQLPFHELDDVIFDTFSDNEDEYNKLPDTYRILSVDKIVSANSGLRKKQAVGITIPSSNFDKKKTFEEYLKTLGNRSKEYYEIMFFRKSDRDL